jgi:hypothetical protein
MKRGGRRVWDENEERRKKRGGRWGERRKKSMG